MSNPVPERNVNGQAVASSSASRLTGWSGDAGFFRFVERDRIDPALAADVLEGRLAGAMFRGVVASDTCAEVARRFWASPNLHRRGADAPGRYLGTYHWCKPLDGYLDEADADRSAVDALTDGIADPMAALLEPLRAWYAQRLVAIRLAAHAGRDSCQCLIRSWMGEGTFSLEPHEDESQLAFEGQHGFEVLETAINPVCAINACIENHGASDGLPGGELVVWNIRPDRASKQQLGLAVTGSPYPADSLADFQRLQVPVRAGDVYILNGRLVHAVNALATPDRPRTTMSCLIAFRDSGTILRWT
jgi:hypothetical protein